MNEMALSPPPDGDTIGPAPVPGVSPSDRSPYRRRGSRVRSEVSVTGPRDSVMSSRGHTRAAAVGESGRRR